MRLIHSMDAPAVTPEGMFAAKYAWLLRWAMHFAQNDRAVAEDMVQETFLKLLLSWSSLRSLDNIEPLLYTYLKYTHLSEQRRGRRYSFQSLATIEFDTVALGLAQARVEDTLELQQELRQVVSFLLWRRATARFASIFLLRYFHGYFPEEITRICRTSRHAVDLNLGYAREELRSHLKHPGPIEVMHTSSLPETPPIPSAPSARDLTHDLQTIIFAANLGECLSDAEVSAIYSAEPPAPLATEQLAHIVSCRSCLERISHTLNLTPLSGRDSEAAISNAPRGKKSTRKSADTMQQAIDSTIAAARLRMRTIEEHTPHKLVLALNGRAIAVRDLNAARAELTVEADSLEKIELIEIISDQGLLLLCFPLQQLPPSSPPEQQHHVQFPCGRSVHLAVRFTVTGAAIEITYEDPNFGHSLALISSDTPSALEQNAAIFETQPEIHSSAQNRLRRWFAALFTFTSVRHNLPRIGAAGLAAASIALLLFWHGPSQIHAPVTSQEFLERVAQSEKTHAAQAEHSAIHQVVSIQSGTIKIHADLYRDGAGRRRPRQRPLDNASRAIQQKLTLASIDWNDPLSASGLLAWHGGAARYHDSVSQTGGMLTLKTSAPNGPVARESLTVREADFHPIRRELTFRDQSEIVIAEVNYELSPWNATSNSWFEPLAEVPYAISDTPQSLLPPSTKELSEAAIAEAELATLLELRRLHGDTERLTVEPASTGVFVHGVVETEQRKHEIIAQLHTIPHVIPQIASYQDLDKHPTPQTANSTLSLVSVTSAPAPMETYCIAQKIAAEQCTSLSHRLLQQAGTLDREARAIKLLDVRFHDERFHDAHFHQPSELTPKGQLDLHLLFEAHLASLGEALATQQSILSALPTRPLGSESATDQQELIETTRRDLALTKELLYAGSTESRSASLILDDLAGTTKKLQLQTDILRESLSAPSTAAADSTR
jgi:RNA polymerase sigma factor (sigma-70 family)